MCRKFKKVFLFLSDPFSYKRCISMYRPVHANIEVLSVKMFNKYRTLLFGSGILALQFWKKA